MSNQKDTQKTNINIYEKSNVSDVKSLVNKSIYDFANKKTEKLVTALYLVSDCMDTDDALKGKIRLLSVELLSDIYKLSTLSLVEKQTYLSISLTHIYELLSFINIANTIGFISEMNASILKREFSVLISDLKEKQNNDKHFTFTLDDKMFDLAELSEEKVEDKNHNYTNHSILRDNMSFIKNSSIQNNLPVKKVNSSVTSLSDRQDRTSKILSLIKDNKNINLAEGGVSIKDISLGITDCSEKTIQRELNTLISKGQIKKTGSKRWSRYSVIEK